MEKRLVFYALFVALLMCGAVSCTDTTEVGGVEEAFLRPVDSTLVIVEERFDTEFDTQPAKLYTVRQKVEGYRVLREGETVIDREHFEKDLDLEALFAHPEKVYMADENQLSQLEGVEKQEGDVSLEIQKEPDFIRNVLSQDFNFALKTGEKIKASTKYEKCACAATDQELSFTAVRNIEWNARESDATKNNDLSCTDSTVYDVVLAYDVTLIRNDYTSMDDPTEDTYTVKVPYQRIYKAGDVKEGGRHVGEVKREVISPTTERLTVTTYDQWSVSGKKNIVTDSIDLPLVFNGPASRRIVATSKDFVTTVKGHGVAYEAETSSQRGQWKVTTKPFTYTTEATNGVKTFQNVYEGSSASAVYVYEDVQVKFDYGTWSFEDSQRPITGPTVVVEKDITYDGYDYVDNVQWTYKVGAAKIEGGESQQAEFSSSAKSETSSNAQAEVQILLVPRNLPEGWGDVLGLQVTAVPADDVPNGHFDKRAFCLRTTEGAVAVVIPRERDLPTIDEIKTAYFVKDKDLNDEAYNSAFFTTSTNHHNLEIGKWAPAVGRDSGGGVHYYYKNHNVANVINTDINFWKDWHNGHTVKVSGYDTNVEDGVLTLESPKGNVLRLH